MRKETVYGDGLVINGGHQQHFPRLIRPGDKIVVTPFEKSKLIILAE